MSSVKFTTQSLATKYRPRKFKDVVGQSGVKDKLKGMLKTGNLPNALMFIGPTGTGKTTLAKLFAGYLNCETLDACGKCHSCKALKQNQHQDITEINAASARGIDEIRALVKTSAFKPHSRIRVIIVDEVHQLTPQAAESLLIPLETPPEQTLWVLCTTDPQKIKPTIQGRCTKMYLTHVDKKEIEGRLADIIEKEERKDILKSKEAMQVIPELAEQSGGHVRDAVVALGEFIAYIDGQGGVKKVKDFKKALRELSAFSDIELDKIASKILVACYLGKKTIAHKALLDVDDFLGLANKMVYQNMFLMDTMCYEGRHSKIWWTPANKYLKELVAEKAKDVDYKMLNTIQNRLVDLRIEMQNFAVDERTLISSRLLK